MIIIACLAVVVICIIHLIADTSYQVSLYVCMSMGLTCARKPVSLSSTARSCRRLREVWLTAVGGVLNSSDSFTCKRANMNIQHVYKGRIKEDRACNVGNIRIQMWAGECA